MPDEIRRYLFGEMNQSEREAFQTRLLADQALSDQVRDQETDWIDAYASGRLTGDESATLREYLTATGQTDRVAFARALLKPKATTPVSVFLPALAMAAALVIGFGATFLNQRHNPALLAGREPKQEGTLVYLSPGTLRNGTSVQVVTRQFPEELLTLQLTYQDTQPAGSCLAELFDVSGVLVAHRNGPCGSESFSLAIPASLPAGRYRADLRPAGGELLHTYFFDFVVAGAPAIQ